MSEPKKVCLEEDIAVTTFCRYLRINTSQPTPDYGGPEGHIDELCRFGMARAPAHVAPAAKIVHSPRVLL